MFGKTVKIWITFTVFFLIQIGLTPLLSYHGALPDLLVVLVVFYAYYVKLERLLLMAFVAGLLRDLFASDFLGIEAIGFGVAAWASFLLITKLPSDLLVFRVLLVLIFSLIKEMVAAGIILIFDYQFPLLETLWYRLLPVVWYTTILSSVLLPLLKSMFRESLRQYRLF